MNKAIFWDFDGTLVYSKPFSISVQSALKFFSYNVDILSIRSHLHSGFPWQSPENHPRTDMMLLKKLIDYIYQNDGNCALTEGSDGHLLENLHISGFRDVLHYYGIKIIDVDFEDSDEVYSYGECHYIPKCFKDYPVRISMPAASKRNNMLYSNNVKLFVGAVPRRLYQLDDSNIRTCLRIYVRRRERLNFTPFMVSMLMRTRK